MPKELAGKGFGVLVALLVSACAMQATEDGADEVVVENANTPIQDPGAPGGGSDCAPVIAMDRHGNPYLSEFVCPLPAKPSPDPEKTKVENLRDEWVTGGSVQNSVH